MNTPGQEIVKNDFFILNPDIAGQQETAGQRT